MSHATDFDFLTGRWQVRHRRLIRRLAGDTRWQDFDGRCEQRRLMDGAANVEDHWLDLPDGAYRAIALRAFAPATRLWSIWWLDGRRPTLLDAPVVGRFSAGEGRFEADDTLDGRPIRVRFVWSRITPHSCHWSQAFSADGGTIWETNWEMAFRRLAG